MNKVFTKRLAEAETKLPQEQKKVVILYDWTDEELNAIRPEIGDMVQLINIVGHGNPPRPARPMEELLADYKQREAER